MGKGSCQSCKEGFPELDGQQGRRSPQFHRAEPLAADAKGDQHGAATLVCGTQLSQQWSGACLSHTLKVVSSTILDFLISVLAPLMPSGEFPQEPIYGWSRSADMAVLITCADLMCISLSDMSALT